LERAEAIADIFAPFGNTDMNTNNLNDAPAGIIGGRSDICAVSSEVLFKLNLANPISRRSLF
jgi:hypothetical protein